MAKAQSLDDIMASAFEEEELTPEDILRDPGAVSSGNIGVDYILGVNGFPRGRSIELFGPSQSGKTSCALAIAAQAQRLGERVVYLDFEQALDTPYMHALGVNTEDRQLFWPYPPTSLEQGMDVAKRAVKTGEVSVIVFDSVAAMTPKKSIEADSETRTLAMERARLLGNYLTALNPLLARHGTMAIFINHIRDVIETGPTRPGMPKRTTTPGGTALKFYASVRCEFSVVKTFKEGQEDLLTGESVDRAHATLNRVKVTKNKLGVPHRHADVYLELGRGFNNAFTALKVLLGQKIIRNSGAWYYLPDDLYHPQMKSGDKGPQVQGLQTLQDLADVDPDWGARLVARAQAVLSSPQEPTEAPERPDWAGEAMAAVGSDPEPSSEDEPDPYQEEPVPQSTPPPEPSPLRSVETSDGQTISFVS